MKYLLIFMLTSCSELPEDFLSEFDEGIEAFLVDFDGRLDGFLPPAEARQMARFTPCENGWAGLGVGGSYLMRPQSVPRSHALMCNSNAPMDENIKCRGVLPAVVKNNRIRWKCRRGDAGVWYRVSWN